MVRQVWLKGKPAGGAAKNSFCTADFTPDFTRYRLLQVGRPLNPRQLIMRALYYLPFTETRCFSQCIHALRVEQSSCLSGAGTGGRHASAGSGHIFEMPSSQETLSSSHQGAIAVYPNRRYIRAVVPPKSAPLQPIPDFSSRLPHRCTR